MGDLHLVLPALNLTTLAGSWHFDNGATRKNNDAITEHVVLLCVLPLAVHMIFFIVGGTILSMFYSLGFVLGTLLHS